MPAGIRAAGARATTSSTCASWRLVQALPYGTTLELRTEGDR